MGVSIKQAAIFLTSGVIGLFSAVLWFVQSHPRAFVIADEVAYFTSAQSLSKHGSFIIDTSSVIASKFPFDVFIGTPLGPISKYPPGWPLIATVLFFITGGKVSIYANILVGLAGIMLTYLVGKELFGIKAREGCLAAGILIVSPSWGFYMHTFMSDISSATLIILVYFLCLRTIESKHYKGLICFLSGLSAGFSVTVRYTNLVFIPIFILFFWLSTERIQAKLKKSLVFIAASSVPMASLLFYHHVFFGSWLATGYMITDGIPTFGSNDVLFKLGDYLVSTGIYALPVFGLIGYCGLFNLIWKNRKQGILLALFVLTPIILHAFYYWHCPNRLATSRFILTSLPFLSICSSFFLIRIIRSARGRLFYLTTAMIALITGFSAYRLYETLQTRNNVAVEIIASVKTHLPRDAIIICDYTIYPSILYLTRPDITVIENRLMDTSSFKQKTKLPNPIKIFAQNKPMGKGHWYDVGHAENMAWGQVDTALENGKLFAALSPNDLHKLLNEQDQLRSRAIIDSNQDKWMLVLLNRRTSNSQ